MRIFRLVVVALVSVLLLAVSTARASAQSEEQALSRALSNKNITTCTICLYIANVEQKIHSVSKTIANALYVPAVTLGSWLLLFWILWIGLKYFLAFGEGGGNPLKDILITLVALLALGVCARHEVFIAFVQEPLFHWTIGLATRIYSNLFGSELATNAPTPFSKAFGVAETYFLGFVRRLFAVNWLKITNSGGFFSAVTNVLPAIGNVVVIAVLAIPYFFIMVLFFAFIVQAFLAVLIVNVLSPLLVALGLFPPTRRYAYGGFLVLLQAAVQVFSCMLALIIATFLLNSISDNVICIFADGASDSIKALYCGSYSAAQQVELWSGTPIVQTDYWAGLAFGFLGIILMLRAPALASQIVGTTDGSAGLTAKTAALGVAAGGAALAGGSGLLGTGWIRKAAGRLPQGVDPTGFYARGGATGAASRGALYVGRQAGQAAGRGLGKVGLVLRRKVNLAGGDLSGLGD